MSTQLQPSPQLLAEQCLQVNLDALNLDELRAHEKEALEALAGLNDFLSKPGKSVEAVLQAQRLSRKLRLHMMHLRSLIQGHQAAVAWTHAMASGNGPAMVPSLPKPSKRFRVVRTSTSADNAASGPQGGEAKEDSAHPQAGEASLPAKR